METVPIREALLEAVTARLAAMIPDVPVERARRSPPDPDVAGDFPRLIVKGGDLTSADAESFGETIYGVEFAVEGYAMASDDVEPDDRDLACEQALSALHARVVAALVAWQPDGVDLNEVRDGGVTDFTSYDLDDSSLAAGEFTAGFVATSIRPTGHPYAA